MEAGGSAVRLPHQETGEHGGSDWWNTVVSVLSCSYADLPALQQALDQIAGGEVPIDGLRALLEPASSVAPESGGGLQQMLLARKGSVAFSPEQACHFFKEVLPAMQRLALRIEQLFPAGSERHVPVMLPQQHACTMLTQEECGSIMACSFFGLLRQKPSTHHPGVGFPQFDTQTLLACGGGPGLSTLRCFLHYFSRLAKEVPLGNVTFERHFLQKQHVPCWSQSSSPIRQVTIEAKANIEDSTCPYLVDFANAYVGGGTLTGACMQEEILFATRPECLVAQLFCSRIEDNEAVFIKGAERYSMHSGFGHSFKWKADFSDTTPRDKLGHREKTIIVMDAEPVSGAINNWQSHVDRDLLKAYVAFRYPENESGSIATGNWGCGAFGGDKSLKVIQQMLAASQASRDLVYHTFNASYRGRQLSEWIDELQGMLFSRSLTVGDVYSAICKAGPGSNLFEHLHNTFGGSSDQGNLTI